MIYSDSAISGSGVLLIQYRCDTTHQMFYGRRFLQFLLTLTFFKLSLSLQHVIRPLCGDNCELSGKQCSDLDDIKLLLIVSVKVTPNVFGQQSRCTTSALLLSSSQLLV